MQSVKWDSESKEWVGDGSSPRTHGTSPSMKELDEGDTTKPVKPDVKASLPEKAEEKELPAETDQTSPDDKQVTVSGNEKVKVQAGSG